MAFLLDTHTLLWAIHSPEKLTSSTIDIISDLDQRVVVSAISVYEINNKYRLGKLTDYAVVAENIENLLKKMEVEELPLTVSHANFAASMSWGHRDPFDRMLAAQAILENLILLTNDRVFQELTWLTTSW
jgi:PIN domain nuclease of toxin-antitoxin system